MKKNTMLCIISLGIILILSGCVTIDPTKKLARVLKDSDSSGVNLSKPKPDSMLLMYSLEGEGDKSKNGICTGPDAIEFDKRIKELANTDVMKNLRIGFAELAKLDKLDKNDRVDFEKLSFLMGSEDAIGPFGGGLASWFGGWVGGGLLRTINQVSTDLFFDIKDQNTEEHRKDVFIKLLRFYLTQYIGGKFVLRDGTKLAKPSGNIAHEKVATSDGKNKDIVSASLDQGTVSGLTTVVLEAVYDYCHGTKIVAIKDGKTNYIPYYGEIDSRTPDGKHLYNLAYTKKDVDDYLFGEENNNTPTIVTFYEEALKKDKEYFMDYICKECDKRKKEVSAIRKLSNLAANGSKTAAGTAAKSLGGLGASFGGFLKISIGDNDSVKQIVETVASVAAKRKTEYLLYALKANCETNNSCANNFNKLVDLVEKFD